MSLTLQIDVDQDAGAALGPLIAALSDRKALHEAASDALGERIRDHLADLARSRHATAERLGADPSGFWERMRGGTHAVADASSGQVAMPREMAQRYFGGTIKPTGGKVYLTIAANAAAYGHRAGEFSFLHFAFVKNERGHMQPALVDTARSEVSFPRDRRKGAGPNARRTKAGETYEGGSVYYFLVRQVTQRPDHSVLPEEPQMGEAIFTGVSEYLQNATGGAVNPNP